MSTLFRCQHPARNFGHTVIGPGGQTGSAQPNGDTFADRGQQLQPTEGIPQPANDPNKWNLPITSLPAETPVWVSRFPDLIPRPAGVAVMSGEARPVMPEPPLGWGAGFPDWFPQPSSPATQPASVTPVVPGPPAGWGAWFPDWLPHPDHRYAYQFAANPYVVTVYTGDQAVPIHVPDEVPINKPLTIQVEHDAGGAAVPFDVPPSLRVYHLDAAGLQVVDLAYGVCTQYGANPSYFRNWTPTAKGKFIVEVVGLYLGNVVVGVQTLTVRSNFDPFALADSNILVMRNGDVD